MASFHHQNLNAVQLKRKLFSYNIDISGDYIAISTPALDSVCIKVRVFVYKGVATFMVSPSTTTTIRSMDLKNVIED
jgi:hypothetical protein